MITEQIQTMATTDAQAMEIDCNIVEYTIAYMCARFPQIADMHDELVPDKMSNADLFKKITQQFSVNLVNDEYVSIVAVDDKVCLRGEKPDVCEVHVLREWA